MHHTIQKIITLLEKNTAQFTPPLIDQIIEDYGKDPFLILISCLLSLRAKDTVTIHVCRNLFQYAQTPQELLKIPRPQLEKIIFKIGMHKKKAAILYEVASIIHKRFHDTVPQSLEALLSIKGVGRKTANLVLGLAFKIPGICVDVHVHRISNRLGLIKTKNPEETEKALKKIIPKKYWIAWNKLLVMWGQNICTPRSPHCTTCVMLSRCQYGLKHLKPGGESLIQ